MQVRSNFDLCAACGLLLFWGKEEGGCIEINGRETMWCYYKFLWIFLKLGIKMMQFWKLLFIYFLCIRYSKNFYFSIFLFIILMCNNQPIFWKVLLELILRDSETLSTLIIYWNINDIRNYVVLYIYMHYYKFSWIFLKLG